MNSRTRKAAAVALVAVAMVGIRAASAAGAGLSDEILIGSAGAEQCSSSQVTIDYDVAYDASLQGYGVSAARLSGLDERCQGYDAVVTLSGPGGVSLAEVTAVVDASDLRVVVPASMPVSAEQLKGVSLVLRDAEA